MIEVLVIGLAYVAGVDPWRLGLLALAVFVPLALLPLVALVVMRAGSSFDDRAPLFCDAVSSELRAGGSLSSSLASAAASVNLRLSGLEAGATVSQLAVEISQEFEGIGRELGATIGAAARSGGRVADLFDELGAVAIAQSEIAREIRVSSAPARATAWFFVLAPTAFISLQAGSGSLGQLLDTPDQRVAVVVGIVLFLSGLCAVVLLLWRAR